MTRWQQSEFHVFAARGQRELAYYQQGEMTMPTKDIEKEPIFNLLKIAGHRAPGYPVGVSAPVLMTCPACGVVMPWGEGEQVCDCPHRWDATGWRIGRVQLGLSEPPLA